MNISFNKIIDLTPLSTLTSLSVLYINNNPILYSNLINLKPLTDLTHIITNLHEISNSETNYITQTLDSIKLLNRKEVIREKTTILIDFDKNTTYIDSSKKEKNNNNISKLRSEEVVSPSLKDSPLDIPYVLESNIDDYKKEIEIEENEKTPPKKEIDSIYYIIILLIGPISISDAVKDLPFLNSETKKKKAKPKPKPKVIIDTKISEKYKVTYKNNNICIIIRSDGTSICKYENGKTAVIVDKNENGFTIYSYYINGNMAFTFDENGIGNVYYNNNKNMLWISKDKQVIVYEYKYYY